MVDRPDIMDLPRHQNNTAILVRVNQDCCIFLKKLYGRSPGQMARYLLGLVRWNRVKQGELSMLASILDLVREAPSMDAIVKFGLRLKELREAAGLSQAELANRAGMKQSSVSAYEQGSREPGWGKVVALAAALGVHADAFELEPTITEKPKRGRPKKKPDDAE
jgi:DNA-binding XRE family transcriptional regulator